MSMGHPIMWSCSARLTSGNHPNMRIPWYRWWTYGMKSLDSPSVHKIALHRTSHVLELTIATLRQDIQPKIQTACHVSTEVQLARDWRIDSESWCSSSHRLSSPPDFRGRIVSHGPHHPIKLYGGMVHWLILRICTMTHSLNGEFRHCTSHQPEFQTLTTNLTLPNLTENVLPCRETK